MRAQRKKQRHLHNSPACKSLTKINFKITLAKRRFSDNTFYRKLKARQPTKMPFWVELKRSRP